MSDTIILIPARYVSARFPGKPLTPLKNQPMIKRVFDICQKTGIPTYVVTDNDQIEQEVKKFTKNVWRVDDDVISGTERIALAYERFCPNKNKVQYIINVQGDEPLLKTDSIKRLSEFHQMAFFDITTLVRKETDPELKKNPNRVKVIFSEADGKCLYFSRAAIPYVRDVESCWYHHIGVYSYTVDALNSFLSADPSKYEKIEGLEQMRALETGLDIGAIEITEQTIGVDDPSDVSRVEELLD